MNRTENNGNLKGKPNLYVVIGGFNYSDVFIL